MISLLFIPSRRKNIMALMVSKFHGVPSTMESAVKQFNELKTEEDRPFNRAKYLVLKKQKGGLYDGLPVNYVYQKKPKGKYLKIYKFPKPKTWEEYNKLREVA